VEYAQNVLSLCVSIPSSGPRDRRHDSSPATAVHGREAANQALRARRTGAQNPRRDP
jgi:hypothetical protein